MAKKRSKKSSFLPVLDNKKLDLLVKDFNKGFSKNFKFVNKQIETLKKTFTKYEEPYSEIRQTHRGMNIKIKLPNVKQRNVILNITDSQVEIKAQTKVLTKEKKKLLKVYHRIIDIPPCSIPKQTQAKFNKEVLKIKVPYQRLK